MGIVERILSESFFVKEAVQKAGTEGREAGLEGGQASGARKLLHAALAARFAGLESMSGIDSIGSSDGEQVRQAIQTAAEQAR